MTNTRISDAEILEKRYPVVLKEFSIQEGSGGKGKWNGGNGIRRIYEFGRPMSCSIVSERRVHRPYGMFGGEPGKSGVNYIVKGGGQSGHWCRVGGRKDFKVAKGDWFVMDTPGGGAWGAVDEETNGHEEVRSNGVERRFVSQFQLAQEASN
jgi:5-oxoprolinase (ATP-hydrolysing)